MYKLVKNALKDIDIKIYSFTRSEDCEMPCIVLNYMSTPYWFADNKSKGETYTVLLNVITKSNVEKLNREVLNAMKEAGFKYGECQNTQVEYNGTQVIGFNTAIKFKKFIKEEELL